MTEPKTSMKKNATVAFHKEKEQLYLETDVSDIVIGDNLLQLKNGM